MHDRLRSIIGDDVLKLDLTQVPGLDDLNAPRGPIRDAQQLAAVAYGADDTYFLINGSTAGNQAMLLGTMRPGEAVVVPRNSHRSVVGALVMSGAVPVYMQPEVDSELQIDHCVTPATVERALDEHPNAKAVFITTPTYYGATADLVAIERIAHAHGVLMLVDEAWGPHLRFHPELPVCATTAGADACVNSTHKLIAGMSQTAMLHVRGRRIDRERLGSALRILQSTSPLLVMIASLDVARMQMATQGRALLSQALTLARQARERLRTIAGIHCIGTEAIGRPGIAGYDETRLVITVTDLGATGYELASFLRLHHRVQVEMADLHNVVALVTIGDRQADIDRLVDGVERFAATAVGSSRQSRNGRPRLVKAAEQMATPREAFLADHVEIPFQTSAGHVCAEVVTPYPPGIPVLCPGERITQETIDYLLLEIAAGAHIQGPADERLRTIRVLESMR
jgi:arginine/lysine/ornithine decarboxylase